MTTYINRGVVTRSHRLLSINLIFWGNIFMIIAISGCTKFVQVDPPASSITSSTVYNNDLSAASAVTSIYNNMMNSPSATLASGSQSLSCLGGLVADEFKNYSTSAVLASCYSNKLVSTNVYFWREIYDEIYVANAALDGISKSPTVTPAEKQQLSGEAKFMRAFMHFYGTNLFGDIPLVTTTNYLSNNTISRSPQAKVYEQIVADLKDAQSSLSDNFVAPTGGIGTTERVRPNRGAATALLARIYLYLNEWDSAESQATTIINNFTNYSLVQDLDSVFLSNSTEAIWQLQPVQPGYNTFDAVFFVLTSAPRSNSHPVALSASLVNTFEPGDKRFTSWVDSLVSGGNTYYYPYKYKVNTVDASQPVTEYLTVLRLAEQYLIRAEARAQKGDLGGAATDLNTIRTRAGLPNTTASAQTDLLTAIYHERQVELFTEWGHRWFDLKRTNTINSVMGSPGNVCQNKGGTWDPNWALFPIPISEITLNSNLSQNPGY